MYDRGLPTKFDIFDLEERWPGLCSSQELQVKGYRMRLILFRKRSAKMRGNNLENTSSDVSAIRDCAASITQQRKGCTSFILTSSDAPVVKEFAGVRV
jgi:hypothetical protein